ncbi:UPF0187 protein [Seminavis robusta]|uniref:UPF0187 protein n=1 Tax=Seminavis robusta TaxID=568900 RepID=A0A9N8HZ93_9STRA|nr:UPF0187 protein [Seminavis robusta]|eukprot:Sro2207_g319060.1 UPF0187 protein (445) ;mRNA; f:5115-6660
MKAETPTTAIAVLFLLFQCTHAFLEGDPSSLQNRPPQRRGYHPNTIRPATVLSHNDPLKPRNGASVQNNVGKVSPDSIDSFANDMTTVLKKLRHSNDDPEVPALLRQQQLSVTNPWTLDDWIQHSTRWRFLHYAQSLPTSRLLRRVAPQFAVFIVWTIFAVFISPRGVIHQAVVPLTPLSLVSTFVGALLTMRSNTGLSRLSEGREAWGRVVFRTRDLSQLIATKIYPKDPQLAILMARHVSVFGWVLKAHLRGTEKDVADIVRTMLPPVDAEYILRQRKLPTGILLKLRQACQHLASQGKLTMAEEMALDRSVEELDHALMTTQRITASPIPPLYTSHTSRLLMFYLGFLPLALHGSSLTGFVTFIVSAVVGYTMLGLDEISHLLELPFRLMPLLQLSKFSMQDVGDSLVCPPAPLGESLSQLADTPTKIEKGSQDHPPPGYW